MRELEANLRKVVRGEVFFDRITRQQYSTDASIYEIMPMGVVHPCDAEDVGALIEVAKQSLSPIIPRGGGTSLAGQCVGEAIIVDLSTHMNKILELNLEEGWVRVEPGVVQDDLNRYLAQYGYLFGPDTSTSAQATIGGMCGNNSCGARSVIYGKTSDHILEAEAVLSDGTCMTFDKAGADLVRHRMATETREGLIYRELMRIVDRNADEIEQHYPKLMRRVSGYNLVDFKPDTEWNLAKLLAGSEGTLALATSFKLRISPAPQHRGVLLISAQDIYEAIDASNASLEHQPAAAELVDNQVIEQALASPAFRGKTDLLPQQTGAALIVEFYGESSAEVQSRLDNLKASLAKQKLGYGHQGFVNPLQQKQVWDLRKAGLGLLMGIRKPERPVAFVEDTAVEPRHLREFMREFDRIIASHKTTAGYYGHCSVGCMHVRPLINLEKQSGRQQMLSIFKEVAALVQAYGGAMTGEHGDGLARSWLLEQFFGSKITTAFYDLKTAFDPQHLLNPGKVVKPPSPLDNLRKPILTSMVPIASPQIDFTRDDGYQFALSMCNGNAHCRKKDGVMCPSYQATLDERHSTRGRANALRGFVSGQLGIEDFSGADLYSVMELCVECKACKTECPSRVDMTKMKYHFLHEYNKAHGVPLRSRLFGNVASINRWLYRTRWLSNHWLNSWPNKKIGSLLGIAPQRKLPPVATQSLSAWIRRQPQAIKSPPVVLLVDCLTEYNAPQIGQAAWKVLKNNKIITPQLRCCGRPLLSKGLLDEARQLAKFNLQQLEGLSDMPMIGLEPSCLCTIRDDYPDLVPGGLSRKVAAQVLSLPEWLQRTRPQLTSAQPQQVLVHGHCHQKSIIGMQPTLEVLNSIQGVTATEIAAGCCGMAGSFGYEKEHYEISMRMGNSKLFPALRNADNCAIILADGMSCRHQIKDGTNKDSLHFIEFIAKCIPNN